MHPQPDNLATQPEPAKKTERLICIDALRGFDMFMLLMGTTLLTTFFNLFPSNPVTSEILRQFEHSRWNGFTFEDLIMPLFLFVSGLSMPFAMAKYEGRAPVQIRRILKRVVILWFWGMVVQGLLGCDPNNIRLWGNTLHAILAGYLIAYLPVLFHWKWRGMLSLIGGLFIVYTFAMEFCTMNGLGAGDWTPMGNFAQGFERLLGRFSRGAIVQPDGHVVFSPTYFNVWLFPILTDGANVLFGALAGEILKTGRNKKSVFQSLLLLAAGCVAAGWVLDAFGLPVNKPLYTPSFVLVASGYSAGLLALFYAYCDMAGGRRGCTFLSLFGCNALLCYLLLTVFPAFAPAVVSPFLRGIKLYLPHEVGVWLTAMGTSGFLVLVLHVCNRLGWHLKA